MNRSEKGSELPQKRDSCGLVVDEDAAFASGGDLALYDDLTVFAFEAVGLENRPHRRPVGLENPADHGLFRAMPDGLGKGLVPQQQRQSIDQNRFPGAGLTGQQVEPPVEFDRQTVDDSVIFNS